MERKAASGIMLTLLLISMVTFAFNIQTAKAPGIGIDLSMATNVTIKNMEIKGFDYGIYLWFTDHCNITANKITNNLYGIAVHDGSSSNIISKNNIENNSIGIDLSWAYGNKFYHNNFVGNTLQVSSYGSTNTWDNGYPSGGNYWSDYKGVDANGDGIGDTPYIINANNQDHYPLMKPWTPYDLDKNGKVDIVDLALISAHWYPGPPIGPLGYDPDFDINNDGAINMLEVSIVSAYWTGPPKGPLDP